MSKFELCRWIYLNEEYVEKESATVNVVNHGFNFGTTVFEALRVYYSENGPVIIGLPQHLERLRSSCIALGLTPCDVSKIKHSIVDFITKNQITDGYIRVIVYPDGLCETLALPSHSAYTIFGWHTAGWEILSPLSLHFSYIRRANTGATLSRGKISGLYAIDVFAHNNALKNNFDSALFLNEDGTVCEVA